MSLFHVSWFLTPWHLLCEPRSAGSPFPGVLETHLFWGQKVTVTRHKRTLPTWVFALLWVLALILVVIIVTVTKSHWWKWHCCEHTTVSEAWQQMEQGVALTGRNRTGPPWSDGHLTAHTPGALTAHAPGRQRYRRQMTTDASDHY